MDGEQQLTEFQHFVPCKYLSAWALDGKPNGRHTKVYVRFGEKSSCPMSVDKICAKNSIYGFGPLRADEFCLLLQFLKDFSDIDDVCLEPFRLLALGTTVMAHVNAKNWEALRGFWQTASRCAGTLPLTLHSAITNLCVVSNPNENQTQFSDALKKLTVEGGERFHCIVEDQFWPFFDEMQSGSVNSISDQESFRKVMLYFVDQFMRTEVQAKRTRGVLSEMLGGRLISDAIWNYLEPINATGLTARVATRWREYNVELLESGNDRFVISDNPVVNFASDFKEEPFALFAPISPTRAVFVGRKDHKSFWAQKADKKDRWVQWINFALCSQAAYCVISDSQRTFAENHYYAGM